MRTPSCTRRHFLTTSAATAASLSLLNRPLAAFADEPSGYQLGCYTRPWAQWDYRVAFDGIAGAGFKQVGLMSTQSKSKLVISETTTLEEAAAIRAEAAQRGLKIISIYGGGFPFQKSREAGVEGLRRLIDNAVACECPHLMLGGTTEAQAEAYYLVVKDCCVYAAAKQVGLSIKPHGGGNATGPQCRKIIEKIGHRIFRLWYDPGNIFFYSDGKLDPVEDATQVDGLVVGVSIKDFKPPKEVMVTPGTGQVNFRTVLARLKQGGFTGGPLVVECLESGTVEKVNEEARKARSFLEALTGQKA